MREHNRRYSPDETYVIIKHEDAKYDQYAYEIDEEIEIGRKIRFFYDYYGSSPWSFDDPVEIWAVDANALEEKGEHVVLAKCNPMGIHLIFDYYNNPKAAKCAYRIATKEDAEALLAGVPPEDVYV